MTPSRRHAVLAGAALLDGGAAAAPAALAQALRDATPMHLRADAPQGAAA